MKKQYKPARQQNKSLNRAIRVANGITWDDGEPYIDEKCRIYAASQKKVNGRLVWMIYFQSAESLDSGNRMLKFVGLPAIVVSKDGRYGFYDLFSPYSLEEVVEAILKENY